MYFIIVVLIIETEAIKIFSGTWGMRGVPDREKERLCQVIKYLWW